MQPHPPSKILFLNLIRFGQNSIRFKQNQNLASPKTSDLLGYALTVNNDKIDRMFVVRIEVKKTFFFRFRLSFF